MNSNGSMPVDKTQWWKLSGFHGHLSEKEYLYLRKSEALVRYNFVFE